MYRIISMLMLRKYISSLTEKDQCVSKLNTGLNAVQTWMLKRKLRLNEDNTIVIRSGSMSSSDVAPLLLSGLRTWSLECGCGLGSIIRTLNQSRPAYSVVYLCYRRLQ